MNTSYELHKLTKTEIKHIAKETKTNFYKTLDVYCLIDKNTKRPYAPNNHLTIVCVPKLKPTIKNYYLNAAKACIYFIEYAKTFNITFNLPNPKKMLHAKLDNQDITFQKQLSINPVISNDMNFDELKSFDLYFEKAMNYFCDFNNTFYSIVKNIDGFFKEDTETQVEENFLEECEK